MFFARNGGFSDVYLAEGKGGVAAVKVGKEVLTSRDDRVRAVRVCLSCCSEFSLAVSVIVEGYLRRFLDLIYSV